MFEWAEDLKRDRLNDADDIRIRQLKPLIPPQILMEDFPLTKIALKTVSEARRDAESVIKGTDDRLLVIVGPCSIHDPIAAIEYASRLKSIKERLSKNLVIIMRVYFEKPRTNVGWKGLINDPSMDGSFMINKGLKIARQLLLDINDMGIPAGVEFLDTLTPQYIGDLVSWGAIGARTTESQVHRELASGLSVSVGFKNGTDGNIQVAIDAIRAASAPHHFLSVSKQGISAIVSTTGNSSCHVILRGSSSGPNYSSEHVIAACKLISKSIPDCKPALMIDCSHGNSSKKFEKQIEVAECISKQLCDQVTKSMINGVMIESNLFEGRQDLGDGTGLKFGVSVTDACISWEDTIKVLDTLADAVEKRRSL